MHCPQRVIDIGIVLIFIAPSVNWSCDRAECSADLRSRQDSETFAAWFCQQNLRAAAYHAGLSPSNRRRIEADWLNNRLQFVVCTSAFGMGINKPDVRFVAHLHPPLLLSEYVQEIGRAGRDGRLSQILLLASEPTGWLAPADRQ